MADKEPKRVLGPGAVCCGEGCGLFGCEERPAEVPVRKELDLTDEMASEDKA